MSVSEWQKQTELFDVLRRIESRCECATEDCRELLVQTTDAHLLKVPLGVDQCAESRFSKQGQGHDCELKTNPFDEPMKLMTDSSGLSNTTAALGFNKPFTI